MENTNTVCPVCTLYLREGINLQAHLETHPKEQVIAALLKISNGGTYVPQAPTASTSTVPSQMPVQTFTNSQSSFISAPYLNPQTQMTTAVTYQHFMTSNGSAIMPQYIQVPTIVNPNGNIPVISNQAMNFIPNQSVNYSQTVYNPLYNPYIPQPYPFNQQLYTSLPISAPPTGGTADQPTTQNESLNESDEITIQEELPPDPNLLIKKCTALPGKQIRKRLVKKVKKSNTKCKKSSKIRRVFKPKVSEPSSSLSVIKSPMSETTNNKESTGAKGTVIRTLRPKSALGLSNMSVIPPAPLTPITKPTTNSMLDPKTPPPPPPLSKAPCIVSQSTMFIKSEDTLECARPHSTPAIIIGSHSYNEFKCFDEPEKVNSVIVDSNNTIACGSENSNKHNQLESQWRTKSLGSVIATKSKNITKEIMSTPISEEITITKVTTAMEDYHEGPEGEDEEEINREIEDCDESTEKQGEYFEMIEVGEESKVTIMETALNQERSTEGVIENHDEINNRSSDSFQQSENNICNGNLDKNSSDVSFIVIDSNKTVGQQGKISDKEKDNQILRELNYGSREFGQPSRAVTEDVIDESTKKQSDLPPTINTSRVLCDLTLPTGLNLSSYMEVEGIKIFFNNNATTTAIPFDPILKFSSTASNNRDVTGFMKTENSVGNSTIMDSVIHLVSGNSESKNGFTFGENYTATTSQGNESQMDLSDLSPLPLNIQADESMPARGELSEQESLGAENSTWNLFHGSDSNNTKSLEDWKNSDNAQIVSVIGTKKGGKTFKCSVCSEVFSCPKERRVHKNTVHFNKMEKESPTAKKQKQYPCSFCSGIFMTLRDRRMHVLEMHLEEHKNKKPDNQIKEETADSEAVSASNTAATIKHENDQGNNNVKTETSIQTTEMTEAQRVKYCSQCSLPFVGIKKLREHLRVVHGEIRFKCETCSQTFDEDAEYNEHLLVHPLVCDKCGKTFHKRPNLNLHLKRHLEVKPYECSLCPKSFITRQKLEEHMNGHSGKKPLKCSLCDKTFSRHSNLIQHRNIHHFNVKKKIKDFVCRCGEVFHSFRKLEWHKEVHESKPKPCPFCAQKFIHSASVTRHIRRAHLPDYLPGDNREYDNVQCPVCEKVYLRSSLVVHMRVHNGEKPFACKICNKRFSTKWNLELHNWTHQSRSNMPFKCQICKGAFFREPDFVAHMNAHRNYKPFTCNVCGQKFIRKYSCIRHQEEHKKSKQFVCAVSGCAKSFHRGYYLRDHMKVHTGVRPHTCHICGKASSTKSNHNKHVRIHDTREPVNTEN